MLSKFQSFFCQYDPDVVIAYSSSRCGLKYVSSRGAQMGMNRYGVFGRDNTKVGNGNQMKGRISIDL